MLLWSLAGVPQSRIDVFAPFGLFVLFGLFGLFVPLALYQPHCELVVIHARRYSKEIYIHTVCVHQSQYLALCVLPLVS